MLFTILLIFLWKKVITVKDEIIFGVYRRYNKLYWLKFTLVYLWLMTNNKIKIIVEKIQSIASNGGCNLTIKENSDQTKIFENNYNWIQFIASNSSGYSLILGIEREGNHALSSTISILIPRIGKLRLPEPTSSNGRELIEDFRTFWNVNGLRVQNVDKNKWKIDYNGTLINEKEQLVPVELWLEWNGSPTFQFNHQTDNHPKSIARSAANSIWSKDFLPNLKESNGNRKESLGKINGVLKLNSTDAEYEFKISKSLCSHSFGKNRDLSLHRYAEFVIFLINDSCVYLNISNRGLLGSSYEVGFYSTADGKIQPIDSCDFHLYQNGENGNPPIDHAFQISAGDQVYTVQIKVDYQTSRILKNDGVESVKSKIIERYITCDVNEIPGCGISEFYYNKCY